MLRCFRMICWSIFHRFWSQLPPPEPSKTFIFLRKNEVFSKNHLLKITSFKVRFCKPTCLNFGSQNPSKSSKNRSPRGIEKLINFGFEVWSICDRFWLPLVNQDGPKLNQKPNKKGCEKTSNKWSTSEGRLESPKNEFIRPKGAQRSQNDQKWSECSDVLDIYMATTLPPWNPPTSYSFYFLSKQACKWLSGTPVVPPSFPAI
jgi:hypothetical protein